MFHTKRLHTKLLFVLLLLLPTSCVFDAPSIVIGQKTLPSNARCGNGFVEGKEECDDGNSNNWDGCSSDCRVESGWSCETTGNLFTSRCVKTSCRISGTVCVDHNRTSGDGCDSDCNIEPGWTCEQNTCSACLPDSDDCRANCYACSTVCGDGIVVGGEQCDYSCKDVVQQCFQDHPSDHQAAVKCIEKDCLIFDNAPECTCDLNASGPDGEACYETCSIRKDCAKDCTWSVGWCIAKAPKEDAEFKALADSNRAKVCAVEPKCGDGIVSFGLKEECDDGNTADGDGCSHDCKVETGWICTDFVNPSGTYIVPVYYRDKPKLIIKDSPSEPPEKYLSAAGLPVFPKDDPRNKAFTGRYTIKDVMIFSRDTQSRSALGRTSVMTSRTESQAFNPFNGRFIPAHGVGGKDGINKNSNRSGFSSEIKIKFIFNQHMIGEQNKLTFVGDDDVFVFINGIYASPLRVFDENGVYSSSNKDLSGGHPARTGELVIQGELDQNNLLYNSQFGMHEGQVYEMDIFHINRQGAAQFSLSIPSTIIGPSFCEKCGNGFQDIATREVCDDGNNDDGDGCSSSCTVENGYSCYEDYEGMSHCLKSGQSIAAADDARQ